MKRLQRGIVCAGLCLACACAGGHRQRAAKPAAGVESPPLTEAQPTSGAVALLLQEAAVSATAGALGRAEAALERAVRIAPQDPLPWNRLGELRLLERRCREAEELAHRSLQLAAGSPGLMARNWLLIAHCRDLRGDPAGAQIARQRAADQQGAPGTTP